MIGQKEIKHNKTFNFISYKDGAVTHNFNITMLKSLVGSYAQADLLIESQYVSHYHAFVTYCPKTHEITIIDLNSKNGTFVNGERIIETKISEGDRIQFGEQEYLLESFDESVTLIDQDRGKVKPIEEKLILERTPELPPLPGLTLVDGEYCDISFDETNIKHIASQNFLHENLATNDFIDFSEENTLFAIEKESDNDAIDITVLSNGSILSSRYFSLNKNREINMSNHIENKKTFLFEALEDENKLPFLAIQDGTIKIFKADNFIYKNLLEDSTDPFQGGTSRSLNEDDCLILNYKSLQIIIKKTKAPSRLKNIPLFARDKEAYKQLSKTVGAIMTLMLLLLFVDTAVEKPKEPKKLSIIYKIKSKNIEKLDTQPVANTNIDTTLGQTKTENKSKKVAQAAAPKAVPKKSKKQPAKKMAATKAPTPKQKVKKPKMKAYEFKMKKSFANLFNKNKSVKNLKVSKNSSKSFDSSSSLVSNTTQSNKAASKNSRKVAGLGSDFKGSSDQSFGTKGFSRSGFDTTSMSTKTVVMGSIDPELLRKILREYIPQFKHCYQNELRDNSEDVKGIIDLNFRINPNGTVSKVNIKTKSTSFSNKGVGCMASVLKLIDFPSPKGGGLVDVRQPLNFLSERERIN